MSKGSFERLLEKYVSDARSFFVDAFVALSMNGISGDYVEFGAYGSKSLSLAHEAITLTGTDRHIWAFDSFRGLPPSSDERDFHPRWGQGGTGYGLTAGQDDPEKGLEEFHAMCERFGVPRDAYTTVPGWFDETLPALGATGEPVDIALAYIDCNMYSSTKTVLEFLAPRLKNGMIIGVDDYECWTPDNVSGERLALREFELAHPEWHLRRYRDIHWGGVSFVVERADLLPSA